MKPTQWYPYFRPDQVLTDDQLNQLAEFIINEERMTRRCALGIGIVCGLDVSSKFTPQPHIRINGGVGITSAGYLAQHQTTTYTHSKSFEDESGYGPFADLTSVRELLTGVHAVDTTVTPLTASQLNEMVTVLFVEDVIRDPKACIKENCDTEGSKHEITIRPVLIHLEEAELLRSAQYGGTAKVTVKGILNGPWELDLLKMGRLSGTDLTTVDSEKDLLKLYKKGIDPLFKGNTAVLDDVLGKLWEIADALLKRTTWMGGDPGASLSAMVSAGRASNPFRNKPVAGQYQKVAAVGTGIQYFYDYLKKLLTAADELRTSLLDTAAACRPSADLFPRHLFLGRAVPLSTVQPRFFRQTFISAYILNHQRDRYLQTRRLLSRLSNMAASFFLPVFSNKTKLRITPGGDTGGIIGKQAIPYYFDLSRKPALVQSWNPEYTKADRASENLSWYGDDIGELAIGSPLKTNLDALSFFRIEGHLGRSSRDAEQRIQSIIRAQNLPVDVKVLRLDTVEQDSGGIRQPGEKLRDLSELNAGPEIDKIRADKVGTERIGMETIRMDYAKTLEQDFSHVQMSYLDKQLKETAPLVQLYTKDIGLTTGGPMVDGSLDGITYLPSCYFQDMHALFDHIRMQCMCELSGILTLLGQISVQPQVQAGTVAVLVQPESVDSETSQPPLTLIGLSEAPKENATAEDVAGLILNESDNVVSASDGAAGRSYVLRSASGSQHRTVVALAPDGTMGWREATGTGTETITLANRIDTGRTGEVLDKVQGIRVSAQETQTLPNIEEMYLEYESSEITDIRHYAGKYAEIVADASRFVEVVEKPLTLLAALKKIFQHLSKSLPDFDVQAFAQVYRTAQGHAQDYLVSLRSGAVQAYAQQQIAVALYESVTKLAYGCCLLQLQLFFKEVLRRWQTIRESEIFKEFANKHPGMEHHGGVSRGGTFIMVADPEGLVVADFALPYICCSTCPPVTVCRPDIVFKLPVQIFHTADPNEYKFILSPPGGVVDNPGGIRYDELTGDYYFNPGAEDVAPGDLSFIYSGDFGEKGLTITVGEVETSFEVRETTTEKADRRNVTFRADMEKADAYVWNFGDDTADSNLATGREVDHTFRVSTAEVTSFTVTLEVGMGGHAASESQDLSFEPCTAEFNTEIVASPFKKGLKILQVQALEEAAESYSWFIDDRLVEKVETSVFSYNIPAGARVLEVGLTVIKGKCRIHNEEIVDTTTCTAQFTTTFIDPKNRQKGVLVRAVDKTADKYVWKLNNKDNDQLSGPESVYLPAKSERAVVISLAVEKGRCQDGPVNKTVIFIERVVGGDIMDGLTRVTDKTTGIAEDEAFSLVLKKDTGVYEKTGRVLNGINEKITSAESADAYVKSDEYNTAMGAYAELFTHSQTTIKKITGENIQTKHVVVNKLVGTQAEHFLTLALADAKDLEAGSNKAKSMDGLIQTVKAGMAKDEEKTLNRELIPVVEKALADTGEMPEMNRKLKELRVALQG